MVKGIKRNGKVTAWIVVLTIILGMASVLPVSVAAQSTVVSIQDASAKVGETVQVSINITNVTDLGAVTIWLSYNSSVVSVNSVSDGNMGSVIPGINNTAGLAKMSWFTTSAKTGDYVFAYVTLNATGSADDTSELNLTVKKLNDKNDNAISYTEDDGVFTVETGPVPLAAEAGGPYSGLVDQSITLTGSATGGTSPYSYAWDLDNDGEYDDETGATTSKTWSTADTYTIGLQVTDSATNVSNDTATVVVSEIEGALVSIQDASADTGETVQVPINITNVTDLGAATIWLSYDNSVVIVDSVSDGDMGSVIPGINNTAGLTKMSWFTTSAKTGDFVFAYVTLNATGSADDTSELNLTVKKLNDKNDNAITYTEDDGVFTVGEVAPVHDVYVDTGYTGTYGTGIRIDNATATVPLAENLTIGESYYVKYKIVNNGTAGSEDVAIKVTASNATGWSTELASFIKTINVYHINTTTTWDTTGLAAGTYTITVNASITNDAYPADNERTRDVTLETEAPAEEPVPVSDALDSYYKPDIALSNAGTIYVAFEGTTGIDFAKSTNDGVSFNTQIPVSTGGEDAAIAADGDNVYVVWLEDYKIYYAKSANGGDSFDTKVQVNDGGSWNEEPDVAVNSSGVVYVVWEDDGTIYIDKSADGTAFGTDVIVNGSFIVVEKPSIAIDGDDNILVAWSGRMSGMTNYVYLAKSIDGGAAFSPAVMVSAEDTEARYPSVVVDPADSNKVYVVWVDYGEDVAGDIYVATSPDGGAIFDAGVKVNDDTTDAEQKFPCMAVNSSGAIFVVWQDGRNYETSDYDVYFAGSDGVNRKVNPDDTKAVTPTLTVDDTNAFVAWRNTDDQMIYFGKMPLEVPVEEKVLTTITVSPETANLTVNETQVFTATAYDQDDVVMAGIVIAWTSSNETVGTVSPLTATTVADGTATTTFTAGSVAGTAEVMAASGDVSETAEVTVTTVICGDVAPYPDGNGLVDMGDVVLLLNHVGNPAEYPVNEEAGDVKCTGDINMGDVVLLLNHVSDPVAFPLDCCS